MVSKGQLEPHRAATQPSIKSHFPRKDTREKIEFFFLLLKHPF